jgi:hypothetical protein
MNNNDNNNRDHCVANAFASYQECLEFLLSRQHRFTVDESTKIAQALQFLGTYQDNIVDDTEVLEILLTFLKNNNVTSEVRVQVLDVLLTIVAQTSDLSYDDIIDSKIVPETCRLLAVVKPEDCTEVYSRALFLLSECMQIGSRETFRCIADSRILDHLAKHYWKNKFEGVLLASYSYLLYQHFYFERDSGLVLEIVSDIFVQNQDFPVIKNCLSILTSLANNEKIDVSEVRMRLVQLLHQTFFSDEEIDQAMLTRTLSTFVPFFQRKDGWEDLQCAMKVFVDILNDETLAQTQCWDKIAKCIGSIHKSHIHSSATRRMKEEINQAYHRLARSHKKEFKDCARKFISVLQEENLVLTHQIHVFSAREEIMVEYYKTQLDTFSPHVLPKDLSSIIIGYSTDGYRAGQHIDVQDDWKKWCAGQVVEVGHTRIKVHYVGWAQRYNEWIDIGSGRLAPAFTYTAIDPSTPREISTHNTRYPEHSTIGQMIDEKCLLLPTTEAVMKAFEVYGWDIQSAINGARFKNFENLRNLL